MRKLTRVFLITVDSLRYDAVPQWFLDQDTWIEHTNAWSYAPETVPSLLGFFTGVHPKIHGVERHIQFHNYELKRKTIFEDLTQLDVKVRFTTNEPAISKMQGARRYFSQEENNMLFREPFKFINSTPDCFLAMHIFHPTHIPYGNAKYGHHQLIERRFDIEFLKGAKTEYLQRVNEVFKRISSIKKRLDTDVKIIISSDHGEVFGEEGLVAHGVLTESPYTLHIPLLISSKEKSKVDDLIFPSYVYKKILNSFTRT